MTNPNSKVPVASYGVLQKEVCTSTLDSAAEQIKNVGYAIIDSGYSPSEIQRFSEEFDRVRKQYVAAYGKDFLADINELQIIRALFTHSSPLFQKLVFNANLLALTEKIIPGKFILNQQNGVTNPPQAEYSQGLWHRDLPYQHFVSSNALAINFLFCIDDFTVDNGGTFVLPATHKLEAFPSDSYVQRNALQIVAPAGSFIAMDCMLFHSGGANKTQQERRAVNHVFNVPFFKQQINLPKIIEAAGLTDFERSVLGFNFIEPQSVDDYLENRAKKIA